MIFGITVSTTPQTIFAQVNTNQDLAVVSINGHTDGISTGTVYIYDANYTLIRVLDSPEEKVLGQFSGDILYKNNKLILSTPSRVNTNIKSDAGPLKQEGAVSIFDGTTGSLIKTISNPQPNTVKDYVGGTFGSSVTYAGNKIVIGNPNHDINGVYAAGTVYIYDDVGNLLSTIENTNPVDSDNFGTSLASLEDKIIIGIPNKVVGDYTYAGIVSIYDVNSGNLLKTIKNPNPSTNAKFGSILDISENKLLVTSATASVNGDENVGEAYLFDVNSDNLLKTIKNPNPNEGDMFGRSALFAGDKIVISAIGDGVFDEGSVYVFDSDGKLLNTIHSPQQTPKSGFYSNEFGISLAVSGNRLAVGDDNKMTNDVQAGGAYIFDITTGELLQTIVNPASSPDAFGYYLEFVGDIKPSPDTVSKIIKQHEISSAESTVIESSDNEVWIEPKQDSVNSFVGTLQYDKIPENFKCDITPKINYQYVEKNQHAQYPEYDSLFVRIGGEETIKDLQMIIGLWNEKDKAYAKDLSFHIILKNQDGSDRMGAIYSPDAYSDYSTLGLAIEANSNTNKDGIVSPDIEKKFAALFGSDYVVPVGIKSNGEYQLFIRAFDSEDDWISADTCGLQAIVPIIVNGEDDVTVGKIQFSNILVSPTDTNHENFELSKQHVLDAVAHKNNESVLSEQKSKDNITNISKSEHISPRKQFNAGARIDKIQCNESLQTILKTDGTPVCVKPDSIEKLRERGWTNSKILSDELVREKLLELTGLLESGNVAEFNEIRTELVAFVLLERVDAAGMNLDGINLEHISLPGANLHNATLKGANIGNADLSNANLQGSDLKGADLSYTRLWGANLHGANLQDSNLEGASFRSADLTLANLQNANLKNADFPITANLSNTDFSNAKNFPISINEAIKRGALVD
ncbi:MAG: pentapeptide repeat-containing protein [Nitrosarchaeum sp.]|nr:pentapeptide repeat-containing protein [Nitrosarchaeum sp.]